MKFMKNTTVKTRLLILLGFACAAIIVVSVTGFRSLDQAQQAVDSMYRERLVPTWQMGRIMNEQMENTKIFQSAVSARSVSAARAAREDYEANREQIRELWVEFKKSLLTDRSKEIARTFEERRKAFNEAVMPVFDIMEEGDFDTAAMLRDAQIIPAFAPVQAAGEELLKRQLEVAEMVIADIDAAQVRNRYVTLTILVLSLLILAGFGWALIMSIRKPIEHVQRVLNEIRQGRLGHDLVVEGSDEISEMMEALAEMDAKLSEIVSEVRSSSDSVSAAAVQISQGNDDLSQRTQEQASSLEETASSMEEMTATVKQNADNARQANQLAAGAREQAEKGGEVVTNAVGAMREINASSKKIADIIGVIDEIAFQTNLLALNAAVEAARAGEQGRGFAVVATEVRNLAQRSAKAAHEIKDLINDSVAKVDGGSKLVEESGDMLQKIRDSVRKVTDIVAEIAAASQEQSAGIEQVNSAVMEMDQMTQQNAALVEEASAASRSMDEQASLLIEKVSFFHIGDETKGKSLVRPKKPDPVKVMAAAGLKPAARTVGAKSGNGATSSKAGNGKAVVENAWQEF